MLLSLLPLLLLLVSGSQASNILGAMMTYYPEDTFADGSVSVILRYKLNYDLCSHSDTWVCSGNCGTETQTLALSDVEEVSGEWCQREGAITHLLPNNTGFQTVMANGSWINNLQNGYIVRRAVTDVEVRNRSDIGKPNTSPQTTILPALRIPSNCAKNIDLLAFDPDGDEVRCRYGNTLDSECDPCTPPSVLSVSSNCSLSFSPTYNNSELPYAVQLVIEDFPTQDINLIQTDGSQEVKTTNDAISKIPLQFVLKVGPPVPSCAEGDYLPRFLSPTPEHRAQLYVPAGQALVISISAEATQSNITGLLYSGPHNAVKASLGSGSFSLTWTPSASEDGQSHPICFVVQANYSNTWLHSDLRCVIVTVGNSPTTTTTPNLAVSTATPTILQTTAATNTTTTATTTTPTSPVVFTNQTTLPTTVALPTTTTTTTTVAPPTTTTTTPTFPVVSLNQTTLQTTVALPTTTTTTTTVAPPTTTTTTPTFPVVSLNQTTLQTTVALPTTTTTTTTTTVVPPTTTTTTPTFPVVSLNQTTLQTTVALPITTTTTTTVAPPTTTTTTPTFPVVSLNQTTLQTTVALPTTTTTTTTVAPPTTTPTFPVVSLNQTTLQTTVALPTTTTTTTTVAPPTTTTTTTTVAPPTTTTTTVAPPTTTTTTTTVAPTTTTTTTTTVAPPTTTTTTVAPLTTTTTTPTSTTVASTVANVTTSAPGPQYVIALNMKISTTLSMADNSDYILALIKSKLIEKGLPSNISLRLLSSSLVVVTTSSP